MSSPDQTDPARRAVEDMLTMLRDCQQRMEDWESVADKPSRGKMMTHALLQGAYAAEIEASKYSHNPYLDYDYRWSWMTGFDLGRRIDRAHKIIAMCGEGLEHVIELSSKLTTAETALAESQRQLAERERELGEARGEIQAAEDRRNWDVVDPLPDVEIYRRDCDGRYWFGYRVGGCDCGPFHTKREAYATALEYKTFQRATAAESQLAQAQGEASRLRNVLDSGKGQSAVSILYEEQERVSRGIAAAIAHLQTIVCTGEPDDGVVLLSNDGPCHYDAEQKCQVYDHAHFSPLGDALIKLHEMLSVLPSPAPTDPLREQLRALVKRWRLSGPEAQACADQLERLLEGTVG